jgi:phosphoenolpyruvate phosphomutase
MNEGDCLVQRNIDIDPKVWSALKIKATELNKNVRELAGEILTEFVNTNKIRIPTKPKAIILAAGPGKRLMPLTKDKPKCMLEINGKTLLQRQIEVFKKCGIDDIIVVRGHKKNAINYPGLKYFYNVNYQTNNILESMFCAESEMTGEFVVTYSDIWFDKFVLEKLLNNQKDISLIIDRDWYSTYEERYQHPIEEAEKVLITEGKIRQIGKGLNKTEAYGEFIGLAKFTEVGTEILKSIYRIAKNLYSDKPFHEASVFEKAYLTDMIQELIDRGFDVHNVDIEGNWIEIDTNEDYQKALKTIN